MSAENLITQHLDTWTQAIETKSTAGRGSSNKLNLVGIQKLRELILEMAVRGLLVPQDPNDEPARVLVEKIAAEKSQLIKDGKIKKAKKALEKDMPATFIELPKGWCLASIEELVLNSSDNIVDGPFGSKLKASEYVDAGIPIIRIQNIDRNNFKSENISFLTEEKAEELQRHNYKPGDIVLNKLGEPTGKTCLIPSDFEAGIIVADIVRIRIDNNATYKQYLVNAINANFVANQFASLSKGVTRQRVNLSQVRSLKVSIPPLEEQKRIVAKVDELMALCDQLESQTLNSIATHQTLVETLLGNLVNPDNTADIQTAWALIEQNFDVLFTTEASIDQLKQTILQLAVMGKLVPQNPNDEPAEKLLEKIAAEKAQLIKDGKIKKSKPLPEITEAEKPFDLPAGWEWVRVNDLAIVGTGATPSRSEASYYNPPEFNWVTSGETSSEYVFETAEMVSAKAIKETNVSIYPPGTLIMAMYGQGKTRGQITELKISAGTNQACAAIQLVIQDEEHRAYVKNYFKKAYEEIREAAAGGAQPNLNVGKVSANVISLPPLEEQKHIVTKVNELMSLCDQLKTQLQKTQQTHIHLAQSIVQEALS